MSKITLDPELEEIWQHGLRHFKLEGLRQYYSEAQYSPIASHYLKAMEVPNSLQAPNRGRSRWPRKD